MSSSINTACRIHRLLGATAALLCLSFAEFANAQEVTLRPPDGVVAGSTASIGTTGSGSATFYLSGPSIALKRTVQLGQEIALAADELQSAGRYVAVVCAGNCSSVGFFVSPSKPARLAFVVHPSRAPVGRPDLISGVAVSFDEFHNLVLTPQTVHFEWAAKNSPAASHAMQTRDGIAWFRANSGKSAGALHISASVSDLVTRRVVQEVASEPCTLRIKGQRTSKGILVETEPVRDCSGNPVPDGTIVTFTARNGNDISFVDAPVKQDIARATLIAKGPVVVSAASGVATGNELRLEGKE
ncbi:MAG TPA: hypothetical protein VMU05_22610 [Dongiaceae bacterium]|nr:hypothetical protein [Dongiaceae bacterium]